MNKKRVLYPGVLVLGLIPAVAMSAKPADTNAHNETGSGISGQSAQTTSEQLQQMRQRLQQLEKDYRQLQQKVAAKGDGDNAKAGSDWVMSGKDGRLEFHTRDESYSFRIVGQVQLDSAIATNDRATLGGTDVANTKFRRARIGFEGVIARDWEYTLKYNLNDNTMDDAYFGYTGLQLGPADTEILVGNQDIAFGPHVSSKYRSFLEKSDALDTFSPGGAIGASFSAWTRRWNLWVSFSEASEPGSVPRLSNGGVASYVGSGRFAWNFINRDGELLQLMGSAAYRNAGSDDNVRYGEQPGGIRNFDTDLVNTGDLGADHVVTLSPSVAAEYHELSFQGAYFWKHVAGARTLPGANGTNGTVDGAPTFTGWFAQAGWFLTPGDHRSFADDDGTFGRVHPRHPLGQDGWGALQLALRGGELDLNDSGVQGGKLSNIVAALNWWPRDDIRVQLQYVNTLGVNGGPHDGEQPILYAARIQYDF